MRVTAFQSPLWLCQRGKFLVGQNEAEGDETMPTMNQIVRGARKPKKYRSKTPALKYRYNALKGKVVYDPQGAPHVAWRLPCCANDDPEETKLSIAQDSEGAFEQQARHHSLHTGDRSQPAGAQCCAC